MFCAPRVLCCTLTLVLVHLPRTLTVSLLSGTAKRCLSRPVLDFVTLSLDTVAEGLQVFASIFEQSTFFPSDAIVERAMTLNNLFCSKMNPFVETGKALWLQTMSEKLPPASFVDTGSPRKFAACTIEGKRRESTMIPAMNIVLRYARQGDLVTRHNRGTGARDLLYCGPIARLTLWVGGGSEHISPPIMAVGEKLYDL